MHQGDAQGFVALLILPHTRLAAPWRSWVFRAQALLGWMGCAVSFPIPSSSSYPMAWGQDSVLLFWTRDGGAQTASHQPYLVSCAGTWVVKGLTPLLSQHLSGLDGGGASDQ